MDYGLAPENNERARAWADEQGRLCPRRATQVKNIWTPYGE